MDAMGHQLKAVPKQTLEQVLTSDEFLHLFILAVEKVQKEHRDIKIGYFGVMLANMAAQPKLEYDICEHFLTLLDDLNELHLALIMELARHGVMEPEKEGWVPFKELLASCRKSQPDVRHEMVTAALQKLGAYGIIWSEGSRAPMIGTNPVGLWYNSSYSITPTGEQFVGFLREGKPGR